MPKSRQPLSDFLRKYYDVIDDNIALEEWKVLDLGDKPLYEISSLGRVRRIDNKATINPFHSYRKDRNGKFIYERPTYLRVQLYYYENGKRKKKHMEISRLVALHFIPIPDKYLDEGLTEKDLEVNHIHGGYEIYNNTIFNLEWCTTQENINKAFETDLRHPPKGTKHHASYLIDTDVMQICDCIEKGYNAKKTFDIVELSMKISYKKFRPMFYNIKYKKSWRFISINYNF